MVVGSSLSKPFKLLMVAAVVAMIVASALPSTAQNNPVADPLVFGPDPATPGQGDTFSCTGGPPFTVPAPPGNCVFVSFGPPPAGLVCDIPTTVFFLSSPGRSEAAFICHRPAPAQPQQPTCPPATQELGNEAESSNVDLSGDVTSSGDSSNQTAAPLDFGNTGSDQNAQGVLQTCGSGADDAELSGGSMEISPVLDASSDQGVGESSASQQG